MFTSGQVIRTAIYRAAFRETSRVSWRGTQNWDRVVAFARKNKDASTKGDPRIEKANVKGAPTHVETCGDACVDF